MHDIDVFTPAQSLLKPLRDIRAEVLLEHVTSPFAYSTDRDTTRHARHAVFALQLAHRAMFRIRDAAAVPPSPLGQVCHTSCSPGVGIYTSKWSDVFAICQDGLCQP